MDFAKLVRDAYEPLIRAQVNSEGPAGVLAKVMWEHEQARLAAMTDDERTIEKLRGQIRELEWRLDHARRALNGEECGDW